LFKWNDNEVTQNPFFRCVNRNLTDTKLYHITKSNIPFTLLLIAL